MICFRIEDSLKPFIWYVGAYVILTIGQFDYSHDESPPFSMQYVENANDISVFNILNKIPSINLIR